MQKCCLPSRFLYNLPWLMITQVLKTVLTVLVITLKVFLGEMVLTIQKHPFKYFENSNPITDTFIIMIQSKCHWLVNGNLGMNEWTHYPKHGWVNLTVNKHSLIILIKSCRQKHIWKNIWKKMLFRILPTILLQIFFKIILNSKVVIKSNINPDDNFYRNS